MYYNISKCCQYLLDNGTGNRMPSVVHTAVQDTYVYNVDTILAKRIPGISQKNITTAVGLALFVGVPRYCVFVEVEKSAYRLRASTALQ